MKTSELAGISCDFRETTSEFLCTSDCVAERKGFEPAVQFLRISLRVHESATYRLHRDRANQLKVADLELPVFVVPIRSNADPSFNV
jgi:hypothetical protein